MPKLKPIALSVTCALAIAGCAGTMQEADSPPAAQPVLSVSHGVTVEALYRLGRYFEGQARYEQAINAYREAIKRDPLMVGAYTGLGMSLAAQHRYDDAIRQFQAAVVLEPHAAHLHNNLGYAYLLSGNTQEAVKALEEARRLDPGNTKPAENLRIAEAKLANTVPQEIPSQNTTPTMQAVTTPLPGTRLVEVAPQVFELKTSPKPRHLERIEAVPLPPLPQERPQGLLTRNFKLEIANGNGVLGLAKRVAGRLVGTGVRTARLTNQRPFNQPTTEVQYREGYAAEAAAVAAKLQHPVQVKPNQDLASHIHVRLLLGKDALSDVALVVPPDVVAKVAAR
jgi:tetratricopeptide (TPR) repeat protein